MKDISFINTEGLKFPQGSKEHDKLVDMAEKQNTHEQQFVLCFSNIYHRVISKSKKANEVIKSYFYIPFLDNLSNTEYEDCLTQLRFNYFAKTVASIPNIKVIPKGVAEISPFFSQLCAGAMLTDKKGRVLVLVKETEGYQEFHLPQMHMEYTQDIYTKSLEHFICDNANKALNDMIRLVRREGELEPVSLISGCIVNTNVNNSTAMHTLFATIYQVDNFENYDVRCVDDNQQAMILELDEAISAAAKHLMDPYLTHIYTNVIN